MTDTVDPLTRSRMMRGIRRSGTAPELAVRKYLHRCGLRFRVNLRGIPGTPDIVFRTEKVAVFVHGCFWHRHPDCPRAATPEDPSGFWSRKFAANIERDRRTVATLERSGWHVVTIWECESTSTERLDELYWTVRFFGS